MYDDGHLGEEKIINPVNNTETAKSPVKILMKSTISSRHSKEHEIQYDTLFYVVSKTEP